MLVTMPNDLIIQRPPAAPDELLLLFHGVGADAADLAPVGEALRPHRPRATIVSVQAPDLCDLGSGWQWFSVQEANDNNRPARVAAALPAFIDAVQRWQGLAGVEAARTTLVGFSQGAIMALASTQQPLPLCSRIVAIAGRFASPPQTAPAGVRVHLMHGDEDPVIPVGASVDAEAQLRALGAEVTLDRFPGLGHGIDARVLGTIVRRLSE